LISVTHFGLHSTIGAHAGNLGCYAFAFASVGKAISHQFITGDIGGTNGTYAITLGVASGQGWLLLIIGHITSYSPIDNESILFYKTTKSGC
jgi:hypothetical protein